MNAIIVGLILVTWFLIMVAANNHRLGRWACTYLHWHIPPETGWYLGDETKVGTCPRCKKVVMLNRIGKWE